MANEKWEMENGKSYCSGLRLLPSDSELPFQNPFELLQTAGASRPNGIQRHFYLPSYIRVAWLFFRVEQQPYQLATSVGQSIYSSPNYLLALEGDAALVGERSL